MKDIQKFMPLNIQLFAENLEDEGNPNAENKETPATTETKKEERLFTREEVERIKAHEKELILADVKKQQEAQRAEADNLAKMDSDQQKDYEIEKANKRALSAESELNAYKLKDEAIRQASEKGVDLDLMQTLDYSKETAESIKSKIDIFANASKKIHEKAISEYSKEATPQTGDKTIQKELHECRTYEEIAKYYAEHPDAN